MKRKSTLLAFVLLIVLIPSKHVFSQASCPDIVVSSFQIITDPTNSCLKKVNVGFINPTNGQKSIGVTVTCGTSTIVLNECHDASGQQGVQRSFQTAQFICCNLSQLVITIAAYTGNSTCLGTPCITKLSIAGSSLPVYYKSFTATSQGSAVQLAWVTSFEQNNKGFEIQKLNAAGEWEKVSFVSSKADNGNSTTDISYAYSDNGTGSGTTNYRIAQIDLDGKIHYSEVRSVTITGDGSARMQVYPNPTSGNNINVLFSEASEHEVSLYNANGSLLKIWSNVKGSNFKINALTPGFYLLQSRTVSTNIVNTQKIIVTK